MPCGYTDKNPLHFYLARCEVIQINYMGRNRKMQEEKIFHAKNIGKSELVKKKTSKNAGFQVKKFIFAF